jgi:hypothetical protein
LSIKPTDRVARANYRAKTKRITVEFYPNEEDEPLKLRLEQRLSEGETIQGYIKRLIREDINK